MASSNCSFPESSESMSEEAPRDSSVARRPRNAGSEKTRHEDQQESPRHAVEGSRRTPHALARPDFKRIFPETKTVIVKNIRKEKLVAVPEPSEANPRPVFYSSSLEETFLEYADFFYLTKYKNTDNHPGVAVSFNVKIDQQSYMLCSVEKDGEIRFMSGEIPETIDGSSSQFIFFQTAFSTNSLDYKYESSLFRGSYMASEKVNENKYLFLKPFNDPVPEICRFAIDNM